MKRMRENEHVNEDEKDNLRIEGERRKPSFYTSNGLFQFLLAHEMH